MKAKTQKKIPTSIPVLVIGIVLLLSLTLAGIYRVDLSVSRLFSLSNFNASSNVYFMKGETRIEAVQAEHGGVKVSLDVEDDNYIGNLRVSVNYSGCGVGLIRVRVLDEWSVTANGVRTVMPHLPIPFIIDPIYDSETEGNAKKWYDNRVTDGCFYYATPVRMTSDEPAEIRLITGLDDIAFDAGAVASETELHIIVEADVVQVNRYPQYWGLSALPWTDGVSDDVTDLAEVSTPENPNT